MRTVAIVVGATFCVGAGACGRTEDIPTSQLIDIVVERTIDEDSLATGGGTRPSQQVILDQPEYQFGTAKESERGEFGIIDFGVVLDNGAVVVSDASKRRLAYLSREGRLLSTLGRAGEGPGEFGQASGLYLRADGAVVYRDAQHQRANILLPLDTTLQLVRSFRLDSYAHQVCALDGQSVGVRYRPQHQRTLEVMSEDGARVHYIGLPLVRGTNEVNVISTNGSLVCLPDRDEVIFATQTGDLLSYRSDGALAWRRKIPGFLPSQVKVVGGGTLLTAAPPPLNRSMTVRSLVRLDSSTALLQMVILVRTGEGKTSTVDRAGFDSRIIELSNGAELGRQTDLPLILDTRNGMALATAEEPEPTVSLVRFRLIRRGP